MDRTPAGRGGRSLPLFRAKPEERGGVRRFLAQNPFALTLSSRFTSAESERESATRSTFERRQARNLFRALVASFVAAAHRAALRLRLDLFAPSRLSRYENTSRHFAAPASRRQYRAGFDSSKRTQHGMPIRSSKFKTRNKEFQNVAMASFRDVMERTDFASTPHLDWIRFHLADPRRD